MLLHGMLEKLVSRNQLFGATACDGLFAATTQLTPNPKSVALLLILCGFCGDRLYVTAANARFGNPQQPLVSGGCCFRQFSHERAASGS